MTNALRLKIQKYIKNGLDISDLIKDVDIKGENLSRAVIKTLQRFKENMNRTNFSKAKIGQNGKITQITDCKLIEANFNETEFIGTVFFRRNNCQRANFNGAFLPNLQYQKTDFRFATFCEAVLRIGTTYGEGSKFSADLFKDLGSSWSLKVEVKEDDTV